MVSVVSKWFGKKQPVAKKRYVPEGASVVYQSLVQTPGKPVWMAREYQRLADEAYGKNVISHRAINLVAQGAAGVPWLLYNNKEEVQNHQLLNHPNPYLNGTQFIENLIIAPVLKRSTTLVVSRYCHGKTIFSPFPR